MDKKDRSKRILSIIVPIGVLILILSFSYAYWLITDTQENPNTINIANCLTLTLEDVTSAISISGGIPLTNAEGMQTNPYTFKVKNTCNMTVTANINLEVLNTTTLNHGYARVSLQDSGVSTDNSKLLTSYDSTLPTITSATSYILRDDVEFTSLAEKEYDLRLWLDHATTWSQGNNKTLEAKIVIIASFGKTRTTLKDKILADNGGIEAIETRTLAVPPDFSEKCPKHVSMGYVDHENWTSYATTTFSQAWYLSPTYTYNSATGSYRLSGTPVTGFNASHVGWYTMRSTNATYSSQIILKVTGYTSGTSGTFMQKNGIDNPTGVFDNSCSGMYVASDDYSTSYYFRGSHDSLNNNVLFAGYQWKIIRIDGNGDTRMIYNGVCQSMNCIGMQINGNTAASNASLATGPSAFNSSYQDNTYLGYMYGAPGQSMYTLTHSNSHDSIIKQSVDTFYNSLNNFYKEQVRQTEYCNDRKSYTDSQGYTPGGGMGIIETYYAQYIRATKKLPSFHCLQDNDKLYLKMALITWDEAIYGGLNGVGIAVPLCNNYLCSGETYWSMTPSWFQGQGLNLASNNSIKSFGDSIFIESTYSGGLTALLGVRPIITLKSSVTISGGDGSITSPYIVE